MILKWGIFNMEYIVRDRKLLYNHKSPYVCKDNFDTMIAFNKPYLAHKTIDNILDVFETGEAAGDGKYTKQCQQWLEEVLCTKKALLTHSCTGALEMAAILANIQQGDEIIMPSFTFASTANAFVLRGGIPVFIDIHPDNCNMDETLIESSYYP